MDKVLLKSKTFQVTIWVLILFLIILIGQQISFIFHPLVVLFKTIFFPVLIAGILYYLTISVVEQVTKWRVPRIIAIILIYVIFAALILLTLLYLIPLLEQQLSSLVTNLPNWLRTFDSRLSEFQESTVFSEFERFEFFRKWSNIDYIKIVDSLVDTILANVANFLGSVASFVVVLVTIPVLLFFMLKDGSKISESIVRIIPQDYRQEVRETLSAMNDTIRSYVQGQLLVALFIGFFTYVGYLIIGVDYAFLLAVIALFTNIIPYFGPVIGTIPGVIVALITSPWKALLVVIMIFIVQQVESQIISPLVIGKKLNIHPVTIIVLLLTAGSLGGILAVVLAVPTYAVVKVIVTNVYALIVKHRRLVANSNS